MAMASPSGGSRRGRRGRKSRRPMSEINVTPLVDVMLVLLIIFMVTAPLLKAGVPVELPDSRAKALAEEKEQVTLTMRGDGSVYLDDEPIDLIDLPARLATLPRMAGDKMPLVTLRADKTLDYGAVMGVMGELNRAGITSISLVTSASGRAPGRQRTLSNDSGTGR